MKSRREFIKKSAAATVGGMAVMSTSTSVLSAMHRTADPIYKISLAEWSLHRALFAGDMNHLDFAGAARSFSIDGIEYVNQFFKDKAQDTSYLQQMIDRANDNGVTNLLIMIDGEGNLGEPEDAERMRAVENHKKWVDAARFLGCHSIRVNARSNPELSYDEQMRLAADGLRALAEYADGQGIDVIVENHGGPSSDGAWLVGVMKMADHPRVGTLPDFGNFMISQGHWYDRYKGVAEMMPYAKAVSAKSHEFDELGNEIRTDYEKMMRIVLDAGYRGYVGIEYEGNTLNEEQGIGATRNLLMRVRDKLAADYKE